MLPEENVTEVLVWEIQGYCLAVHLCSLSFTYSNDSCHKTVLHYTVVMNWAVLVFAKNTKMIINWISLLQAYICMYSWDWIKAFRLELYLSRSFECLSFCLLLFRPSAGFRRNFWLSKRSGKTNKAMHESKKSKTYDMADADIRGGDPVQAGWSQTLAAGLWRRPKG